MRDPRINCRLFFLLAVMFFFLTFTQAGMVSQWLFNSDNISGNTVHDIAGDFDAEIHGTVNLQAEPPSMLFDGTSNYLTLGNHVGSLLPQRNLTVEAWVRIETGTSWGGIIGYFQDNGSVEHGWVLGYNNTSFTFAVSDSTAMTYLSSGTTFNKDKWYHVAGTYDGITMRIYVNGSEKNSTTERSGDIDYADSTYTIGAYHDSNEHNPMHGRLHEVCVYDSVLSAEDINTHYEDKISLFPGSGPEPKPTSAISLGPYVIFSSVDSAVVHWITSEKSPSILEFGEATVSENRVNLAEEKTDHAVTISQLKKDTKYLYRIIVLQNGSETVSDTYELETNFNFSLPAIPNRPSPFVQNNMSKIYKQAADRILAETNITRGYCLVLGAGNGQLMYELAKQSELMIVGVETDPAKVASARQALYRAGLYGPRANVRQVSSYSHLPFTKYFANLVVSDHVIAEGECVGTAKEMFRLLRPAGGVACLGQPTGCKNPISATDLTTWLDTAGLDYSVLNDDNGVWTIVRKDPLEGAGGWTHQYGNADNSACSYDTLEGATNINNMMLQWIGRPGGDAVMDRNPRKPSPLSANGRVYLQGFHRIITIDSYNGTILWSMEIPSLLRTNMPRDSGNWCIDDSHIYAAIKDKCWCINSATGELITSYNVSEDLSQATYDWGYVATVGDQLFGSNTRKGASYTRFMGHDAWFDQKSGYGTWKVCSDGVFAIDKTTGSRQWHYSNGAIINPTITIGGGRIYFVECRNSTILESKQGRVSLNELWQDQYLVALNTANGNVLWEQPIDTVDGVVVFYLGYSSEPTESLVLASSKTSYYLYGFDAVTGGPKWNVHHSWPNDNHGGHMQHPVLVGGKAFYWPNVYNIGDGSRIVPNMPARSGCPTFAAGSEVFVYRGLSREISLWDPDSNSVTGWESLRPGCWLSVVPADGMILAPEGGSGCSCGGWLQTSVGFSKKE